MIIAAHAAATIGAALTPLAIKRERWGLRGRGMREI
jgi:hypothetical protein